MFKKYWKFTCIYISVISILTFINIIQDPTFDIFPVIVASLFGYIWTIIATTYPHKIGLK